MPRSARPRRPMPLPFALLLGLALSAVVAGPALGAPIVVGTGSVRIVQPVVVDVNLYRSTAIVRQYTSTWCVPASAQGMVNLLLGTSDTSYATQLADQTAIHAHNRYVYTDGGNDVQGWAWFLSSKVRGWWRYSARMYPSANSAIAAIVESINRTHHPVGVVVDHGTHAWTVVGYRATQVPGAPWTRVITGLYVTGPLGPNTTDPWPVVLQSVATFASRFTPYHEWRFPVIWEGSYVIVSE